MCFSATSSFAAGITLIAVGAATVRRGAPPRELAFRFIPLLFGIQQLIEGALWLSLGGHAPRWDEALTFGFISFSHVIWPIYIPVAILLVEDDRLRQRWLAILALIGATVSVYLLVSILRAPISAQIVGNHIAYVSEDSHTLMTMGAYLISTCLTGLLSSHRSIRLFGAVALISFIPAYVLYTYWFISVWCFFAALISVVILRFSLEDRSESSLLTEHWRSAKT